MRDLFTNRRDYFERCTYWALDEEDYVKNNEMVYEMTPTGFFNAKQITGEDNSPQVVGGTFMFDSSSITLKTNDYIEDIKQNYLVEYKNEIWRVTNVQKTPIKKENQFHNQIRYTYYLRLKR